MITVQQNKYDDPIEVYKEFYDKNSLGRTIYSSVYEECFVKKDNEYISIGNIKTGSNSIIITKEFLKERGEYYFFQVKGKRYVLYSMADRLDVRNTIEYLVRGEFGLDGYFDVTLGDMQHWCDTPYELCYDPGGSAYCVWVKQSWSDFLSPDNPDKDEYYFKEQWNHFLGNAKTKEGIKIKLLSHLNKGKITSKLWQ